MQNRKLDNQTLDAIGKKLIVSDARRVADVDAIVSNPRLFAVVRARIAAVETPQPRGAWFTITRFNVAVFSSATAVLLLVVGAFSLLDTGRGVVAVDTIQIPDVTPEIARPVFPPQGKSLGKLSAGRANKIETRSEKIVPRTASMPTNRRLAVVEPDAEFVAVSYTGDPHETSGGGRIIRVDMKRSSLYALGIDVPLENAGDTIKADLLIGADGVTRGVRIVDR
ncbi:MAG: hypothetical protein KBF83_16285 [Pyrinomonadaceae bacterium]|nr:hypothetical protein [Pyrinomonadaceae bacterium]